MWGSRNRFLCGWNLNFSVDYVRAKCQERIGENGIKIRLTVWILRTKWWRTHFLKSWVRTWYHKNVPRFGSYATCLLAECLVDSGHKNVPRFFVNQIIHISLFFTPFLFGLGFGVNMKVLDNFVSFPMDLVWLKNDFYILRYGGFTTSRP